MELSDLKTYTTAEVATRLHTHRNMIDRLRRNGLLSGIKLGKGFIYSEEEVQRFLRNYAGLDLSNETNMLEARQLEQILARRGSLKEASWDLNYLNISINHPADAITEILAALETLLPGMFTKLEADIACGGNRYEFFTGKYEDRRATEKEELTGEAKE